MTPKFVGSTMFVIVLACLVAGAIVYPHLPNLFVSHWNAYGQPNGSTGRFWGVVTLPLIMLVLIGIWAILPALDPLQGIRKFRYVYDFSWFLIISLLAYAYALTLGTNLGWPVTLVTAFIPALAVFFFILGALLPYTKRNWYFGIRTPWTLSSDAVWNKTNRYGSYFLEISALVMLVGLIYPASMLWFVLAPLIGSAIILVIYSYFAYRAEAVH